MTDPSGGSWLDDSSVQLLLETLVAGGGAVVAYMLLIATIGDTLFAGIVAVVIGLVLAQTLRRAW